jgi:hypothetical protein
MPHRLLGSRSLLPIQIGSTESSRDRPQAKWVPQQRSPRLGRALIANRHDIDQFPCRKGLPAALIGRARGQLLLGELMNTSVAVDEDLVRGDLHEIQRAKDVRRSKGLTTAAASERPARPAGRAGSVHSYPNRRCQNRGYGHSEARLRANSPRSPDISSC